MIPPLLRHAVRDVLAAFARLIILIAAGAALAALAALIVTGWAS